VYFFLEVTFVTVYFPMNIVYNDQWSIVLRRADMTIILPPDYVPSDDEEYMNENQLEYFRQKLENWKKSLIVQSEDTLEDLRQGGLNQPDQNDRASLETDKALELRTRDRARKLISKIDSALKRIEDGEYGYCEDTGEPIGLARLEARPVATLSVEAQERHERMEKTYDDEV
jgi:DnaK suppressor protein